MGEKIFPAKILAASEGSVPSKLAILMAGEIAKATGSELHVIGVASTSRYIYPDNLSDAHVERMRQEVSDRVDKEVEEARQEGVEVTATHIKFGRADGEVLKLAEEMGVKLIVVGNRGIDAISRILLGNDAESIVRHAHCPVLVVRNDER